ncbi:flagellar basal body rod protein FlgC [Escherichia coli]|uniref:Flagellar basal body rod protein FlgC n=1 Tax=Escherichia coli TaxID=562 RepID=A0A376LIC2_ECOLX|nr:flagellar basal body rod protein FlgC [Escherichia coli]
MHLPAARRRRIKRAARVFAAVYHHSLLVGTHRHAIDGASVQVQDVLQTGGAVKRYEPHSPLADANGDVWYPDVKRGGTDGGHDVGLRAILKPMSMCSTT